jgi:hypothetical protein
MKFKNNPQLKTRLGNFSAILATVLTLPALAYADHDNHKNGDRGDQGKGDSGERHGNQQIPVVPEANAGWVLLPFIGAVLLFSSRNLFRGKATE